MRTWGSATDEPEAPSVRAVANGPLLVSGVALSRVVRVEPMLGPPRWSAAVIEGAGVTYALCRCDGSNSMPLCDRWPERPCFDEPPRGSAPAPVFTWRAPDGNDGPVVALKTNGPVRVCGGVPIRDENGALLDPGDRASLCRCGHSAAMPFCDGTHKVVGFRG